VIIVFNFFFSNYGKITFITCAIEAMLGNKTIVETVEATILALASLFVNPQIPTIRSFVRVNTFAAISCIKQNNVQDITTKVWNR